MVQGVNDLAAGEVVDVPGELAVCGRPQASVLNRRRIMARNLLAEEVEVAKGTASDVSTAPCSVASSCSSSSSSCSSRSSEPLGADAEATAAGAAAAVVASGARGTASSVAPGQFGHDFCEVCQRGGRLLPCDVCPRAFHVTCIERHVDLTNVVGCIEWRCPICLHGEGVLQGTARVRYSEAEMEAKMRSAAKQSRALRRAAMYRRDFFVGLKIDMVAPFAPQKTLQRLRISTQARHPPLDVGASVWAFGQRGVKHKGVVVDEVSRDKYLVFDLDDRTQEALHRSCLVPRDDGMGGELSDFLGSAQSSVLAEGLVLKPYQALGVNWLIHSFYNRGGGILADDMGLGKTAQTLAALSYLRAAGTLGPFLIVVPLSCAGNWVREVKRFVPHLTVTKLCGAYKERESAMEDDELWCAHKDIVITTYETVASTDEFFRRHCWAVMVLDEAHRIKNQAARCREVLENVECTSRFLLTGTPLQNNLQELHSLLHFLWPDILEKDSAAFQRAFVVATNQEIAAAGEDVTIDGALMEKIRKLLSLVMIRRRKHEVIQLPPKVIRDVWLPMTPEQVSWYKALLNCQDVEQVKGVRALLKLIVRLRQVGAHPRCLVSTKADREGLEALKVPAAKVKELTQGPIVSEETVAESSKCVFLDKLLSHLHSQNMGFDTSWRNAWEERRKAQEGTSTSSCSASGRASRLGRTRKMTAASWLRQMEDSTLFLDEMRPWVPPPDKSDAVGPNQSESTVEPPATIEDEQGVGTVDTGDRKPKPEELDEDIDRAPHPHKVLIFCQYHSSLDLLEEFCRLRCWRYLRMDGNVNRVMRELDMRDFNCEDEDFFIYLIGTRAGGLGVNLASANHVILFDQDWNPHVDMQAIDRAHRIGQRRTVFVYRLINQWGVEERMAYRQTQKLKMERCVVGARPVEDDDETQEACANAIERLSASEVVALLRHGETALRRYAGERMEGRPLRELLNAEHRPSSEAAEPPAEALPAGVEDEYVEAQVGGESNENASGEPVVEERDEAPPPPVVEVGVVRTLSGRVVKKRVVEVMEIQRREPKEKRPPLKHYTTCFCCGGSAAASRPGRSSANEDAGNAPDVLCQLCPKAYHQKCLPPWAAVPKNKMRWGCQWHSCEQCRRGMATAGMLIHCLECPTSLCYDCFPPNYRRIWPPSKLFHDFNNRNWNVNPQTMVFFKCNSCRVHEEQRKRQRMRLEELEAQQDEKKKRALEEKRNLETVKRERQEVRLRKEMRLLLSVAKGDKNADDLLQKLLRRREALLEVATKLWPPSLQHFLSQQRVTVAQNAESQNQCLPLCKNCFFPGHHLKQCPCQPERTQVGVAADIASGEEATEPAEQKTHKKAHTQMVCALCSKKGHSRMLCPSLSEEDFADYEARVEDLERVTALLEALPSLPEPEQGVAAGAAPSAYTLQKLRRVVQDLVSTTLKKNGLEFYVVDSPEASAAKAKILAKDEQKGNVAAKRARGGAKGSPEGRPGKRQRIGGADDGSSRETLQEERLILDGPGEGWSLRGERDATGAMSFAYKVPSDVEWSSPAVAFQATNGQIELWQALERERADLEQTLKGIPKTSTRAVEKPELSREAREACNETQVIAAGPAAGWRVRAKVLASGILIAYRQTEMSRWETKCEMQKRLEGYADPNSLVLKEVLEIETSNLRRKIQEKLKRAKAAPDTTKPKGAAAADKPKAKAKRMAVAARKRKVGAAPARTPAKTPPSAAAAPEDDHLRLVKGPAAGWTLRYRSQQRVWHFRRPKGTTWESAALIRNSVSESVATALDAQRLSIARRYGHKIRRLNDAGPRESEPVVVVSERKRGLPAPLPGSLSAARRARRGSRGGDKAGDAGLHDPEAQRMATSPRGGGSSREGPPSPQAAKTRRILLHDTPDDELPASSDVDLNAREGFEA